MNDYSNYVRSLHYEQEWNLIRSCWIFGVPSDFRRESESDGMERNTYIQFDRDSTTILRFDELIRNSTS
jgi:hypothetical protein